ncbi:synaptosomal-associated protein 29-like [Styela clava]
MSGNPWLDDVESSSRPPNRWADDDEEDFDPDKNYLEQVVKRKEVDMVASTQRSLGMIYESEQVGAATGEELIRQGEALKRTEQRVDRMEQDLKESDRHIASIKSLWGAFVNKFRKEPAPTPVTTYDDSQPDSRLGKAVVNSKVSGYQPEEDHPVLLRQDDSRERYGAGYSQQQAKNERMAQVDDNLDQISSGLRRLKDLGIGLGEEIESQDRILTRLGDKVERVDNKTHITSKQLMKLNHS